MTTYPNPEHERADKAARRRALRNLDNIEAEIAIIRRRVTQTGSTVQPDGDDTQVMASNVRDLTVNLAALSTLAEVREWAAADRPGDGKP